MASVSSSIPLIGGSYLTHTSQLINDGEFPDDNSRYVEESEIGDIIIDLGGTDKNKVFEYKDKSTWHAEHKLDKIVSVTCMDSAGTTIEGQVTINDGDSVSVIFNVPVSGTMSLN